MVPTSYSIPSQRLRRSRRLRAAVFLVGSLLATACSAGSVPTLPHPSNSQPAPIDSSCVRLPTSASSMSWSADGSTLAVEMTYQQGSKVWDQVALVDPADRKVTALLDPGIRLGNVAPAPDGEGVYWAAPEQSPPGIWFLDVSKQLHLVGATDPGLAESISAAPDGIVWSALSDPATSTVSVMRMDYKGAVATVVAASPHLAVSLVDPSGQWVLLPRLTGANGMDVEIHHGPDVSHVALTEAAVVVGMTADHSAVVTRPMVKLPDTTTAIELRAQPVSGGPVRVVSIPKPPSFGMQGPIALSAAGVLAYSNGSGPDALVCFASPSLS